MATNTKAIKNRIKSVKNTKKITKAMQMIAAVKMRKAVEAAVNTRTYAKLAQDIMNDLGKSAEVTHKLMTKREVKKSLLIIVTSNRGLCGSYNSNVLKRSQLIIDENPDINFSVVAIGKKAGVFAKRNELELIGIYDTIGENTSYESIIPIAQNTIKQFEDETFDEVKVIYTDYISGLLQTVSTLELLPITGESIKKMVEKAGKNIEEEEIENTNESFDEKYLEFEPDKEELLNFLIPMLVEIQLYQSVLESSASEHSSRMIAMKNATESAGEMIDGLTLEFNKGRQAAITQEISEIVNGSNQ